MGTLAYVVLIATAVLGVAGGLMGWGLLAARLLGLQRLSTEDFVRAPWVGWCLLVAFLQVWNLFFAVDSRSGSIAGIIGLVGVAINAGRIRSWLAGRGRDTLAFAAIAVVVALCLANQATAQPARYDSGLYHLSSIQWANALPAVPGLGNLHGRLAYNSSFFLYAAVLNVGPLAGRCHHLVSSSLFVITVSCCAWFLWRRLRDGNANRFAYTYLAWICVPSVAWATSSGYASSPSPDVAVFLVGVAIGWEAVLLLQRWSSGGAGGAQESWRARYGAVALTCLAIAGVTAKLAMLALSATATCLALGSLYRATSRDSGRTVWFGAAFTIAMVLLIPWAVRGVVLSGYIAYPLQVSGVDVDWKISSAAVFDEALSIRAWARAPGADWHEALAGHWWLLSWLRRTLESNTFDVFMPVALLVAALALLLMGGAGVGPVALPREYWAFFTMPAVALLFWFFSAPDPRFAGAAFWMAASAAMTAVTHSISAQAQRALLLLLIVALFFAGVNVRALLHQARRDIGQAQAAATTAKATDSGLQVLVPNQGDQCWNAPIPCTPHFNPQLKLRYGDDVSRGFTMGP